MIHGQKVVVVMPAYNAARTLAKTYAEIPSELVDEVILVDDASTDETLTVARQLGIRHILAHDMNKGYGANQKTCYEKALSLDADIVIMLHPDYQYTPKLIPSMADLIATGVYPVVLGSRILGKGAMRNGMPGYKYFFNRCLTLFQNILLNRKLSEYHTGYRAFSAQVLREINFRDNSDDFVFDNQVLLQVIHKKYVIGEISCPARYFPEASSINFSRSCRYGWDIVINTLRYKLHQWGIRRSGLYR
ncbi:MAG: glycosyltransferase family 2 protein [Chitinophagaceae bacterium]|nr:glycosyltransferase family 2 protein [Chitinophagaceae bacterium]